MMGVAAGECDECDKYQQLKWKMCPKCGREYINEEDIVRDLENMLNDNEEGDYPSQSNNIGRYTSNDFISKNEMKYIGRSYKYKICEPNLPVDFIFDYQRLYSNESKNKKEIIARLNKITKKINFPVVIILIGDLGYRIDKKLWNKYQITAQNGRTCTIIGYKWKLFTKQQFENLIPFFKDKNYLHKSCLADYNYVALYEEKDKCDENYPMPINMKYIYNGFEIIDRYAPILDRELLLTELNAE